MTIINKKTKEVVAVFENNAKVDYEMKKRYFVIYKTVKINGTYRDILLREFSKEEFEVEK